MNHNISTEELRKMLEDAWEASRKWQQFIRHGSDTTNAPSSSNTYINSILAALDDGQEGKGLLRECAMRCHLAFPENEQDLKWFDEGLKEQPRFHIKLINTLELGDRIKQENQFALGIKEQEESIKAVENLPKPDFDKMINRIIKPLPVADGEGEKEIVKLKKVIVDLHDAFVEQFDLAQKFMKLDFERESAVTGGMKWVSVEKAVARLVELKPYHIMPYNLGEMAEIGQLIDKLGELILPNPSEGQPEQGGKP